MQISKFVQYWYWRNIWTKPFSCNCIVIDLFIKVYIIIPNRLEKYRLFDGKKEGSVGNMFMFFLSNYYLLDILISFRDWLNGITFYMLRDYIQGHAHSLSPLWYFGKCKLLWSPCYLVLYSLWLTLWYKWINKMSLDMKSYIRY